MPLNLSPKTAGLLSALLPGLGHFLRGFTRQGLISVLVTIGLALSFWSMALFWGIGGTAFLAILLVPPWWCLQAYQASRPAQEGLRQTLRTVYECAHDIRYLGGLFLITAVMDGGIILANPEYSLTLFCSKPEGLAGILAKIQSPAFHILIGYGFLYVQRWALFAYLLYAGFGFINATVNFACFGYGHIRTIFLLSLAGFTAYVLWRKSCFLGRIVHQR